MPCSIRSSSVCQSGPHLCITFIHSTDECDFLKVLELCPFCFQVKTSLTDEMHPIPVEAVSAFLENVRYRIECDSNVGRSLSPCP